LPALEDAIPGDLLQFRDATFVSRKRVPGSIQIETRLFPHHTAIVSEVRNGGKVLMLLHQNVLLDGEDPSLEKLVREEPLTIAEHRLGVVRAYRPVSAGGMGKAVPVASIRPVKADPRVWKALGATRGQRVESAAWRPAGNPLRFELEVDNGEQESGRTSLVWNAESSGDVLLALVGPSASGSPRVMLFCGEQAADGGSIAEGTVPLWPESKGFTMARKPQPVALTVPEGREATLVEWRATQVGTARTTPATRRATVRLRVKHAAAE
jgi:hypothetical protein